MSRTRELLVRAGIVKIFLQVPGVESVEICVGKKPLTDTRGEEVGVMNNDTFVEFPAPMGMCTVMTPLLCISQIKRR